MDLLDLDGPLPSRGGDSVLVVALDGWTDAGRGGTLAAEHLRQQWPTRHLGRFDSDALYDYRDRRPLLAIDEGVLGEPDWPALDLHVIEPPQGPQLVLLEGAEPDFSWQALCSDLTELVDELGIARYIGLGSVPGPVPHTRPVRVISTSSDPVLLDRIGRPHERVIVPASCQSIIEAWMRDIGVTTLGLWARVPHYVAGEYPLAAQVLLQRLGDQLGSPLDTSVLDPEIVANRERLDIAASGSPEIVEHIEQLEQVYDEDLADTGLGGTGTLPTGDQIAAELERFLRNQSGD